MSIPVRVLLLPKFETEPLTGETAGEAQAFYKAYFKGESGIPVRGGYPGNLLYIRDGIAMYLTGMGKVNSAASLTALLCDPRFDWRKAYLLSTGCAGGAAGYATMGDVFVITAAVDYDLGHHADPRDMAESGRKVTWFRDRSYDDVSCKILDPALTDRVYSLVKDTPLKTTERTRRFLGRTFEGADWAVRDPAVLKGTTVSGDNFWKGVYGHANCEAMVSEYGCPDPYALSEMEDAPLACVAERFGMLERYLIVRTCVNMDLFMNGDTPESLWGGGYRSITIASEENPESADIFPVAMENNFRVVDRIVRYLKTEDTGEES